MIVGIRDSKNLNSIRIEKNKKTVRAGIERRKGK